ncbi:MAG: hypothetical protein KGJ44_06090 [Betaproteobacteria bacterium]|nr:hypothetical protein [Betaproteobacteria bacterium]
MAPPEKRVFDVPLSSAHVPPRSLAAAGGAEQRADGTAAPGRGRVMVLMDVVNAILGSAALWPVMLHWSDGNRNEARQLLKATGGACLVVIGLGAAAAALAVLMRQAGALTASPHTLSDSRNVRTR